jgi:iron complex outermembrane receptor protein
MSRDAFNADVTFQLDGKNALSTTFFYTDLSYETPGGLTKQQYDENPRQARPPGPGRGAVEQKAEVFNKSPYLGFAYDHDWNDEWSTRVAVFGSHADFTNPTIRNYEERDEINFGGRAESQYTMGHGERKSKITLGGEYQYFSSDIKVSANEYGVKDQLQTSDKLTSRQMFLFAQADVHLPANFFLTLGGSIAFLEFGFDRFAPSEVNEERNLDPAYSPRIALLNKITPGLSLFGSISRGFSPPSLAELYPSRQIFDKGIQAEKGTNYEIGVRGAFHHKINFDLTAYSFQLDDALVIRRDTLLSGDPEYFVNAGKTSQRGIEAMIEWVPIQNAKGFINSLKVWNSFSFNHYRFTEFVQGTEDYSGNMLTGVPPTVNTSGFDITMAKNFYIRGTCNYVDHIPLNDANTVFANEYFLVGIRAGFKTTLGEMHELEFFAGIDNALDKKYSLGNDLNAAGGRYYNAAADRNYYGGLRYKAFK